MNTVDETLNALRRRRSHTMRKLQSLRKQHADPAEFGRAAAPLIDDLTAFESAIKPHNRGTWTDDEREILRAAYATFGNDKAAREAAEKLNRTESQIKSMAANLGIKRRD